MYDMRSKNPHMYDMMAERDHMLMLMRCNDVEMMTTKGQVVMKSKNDDEELK